MSDIFELKSIMSLRITYLAWESGVNAGSICGSHRPGKTSAPHEVSLCAEPSNINPSNQFAFLIPLSHWLPSLTIGQSHKIGFILVDRGVKGKSVVQTVAQSYFFL